jgi:hypothetical protein
MEATPGEVDEEASRELTELETLSMYSSWHRSKYFAMVRQGRENCKGQDRQTMVSLQAEQDCFPAGINRNACQSVCVGEEEGSYLQLLVRCVAGTAAAVVQLDINNRG